MSAKALAIFAKAPRPGEVKTRLLTHLSPAQAAELHHAFLIDTLKRMSTLSGVETFLACFPSKEDPFFVELAQKHGFGLLDQEGSDLGDRMRNVALRLWERFEGRTVLIGADSPTLPVTYVEQAFHALRRKPVVLGPSQDGGYYSIGLSDWIPELFEAVPWGTEKVLERTLQRLCELKLEYELLPEWFDVDDFYGLKALWAQLLKDPALAPCTENFLREIRFGEKGVFLS